MLASPSDVNEERNIARELILSWNNVHSFKTNIILFPIGWEYNTVPTMGDRPQEIINKTILKNADLLVGIFWTRIGTPTGKSISGSVEEIEEHIKSGKPTMLYFSNKPVVPGSVDMKQYNALKKLKTEYQSRGLTMDFDSSEDFKHKFQTQLPMKINMEDRYFIGLSKDKEPLSISSSIFRNKLSKEAKDLLKKVIEDPEKQITRISYANGLSIKTNSREFVEDNNPRSELKWNSAFQELENANLLKEVDTQGQVYQVTQRGVELANAFSYK